MTEVKINKILARKVLEVVDAGLVHGLGTPEPGKMCVEAAVCYAMGLPHGDQPSCVAPALRALKIRLNDQNWSSDQARARSLRRLAIAQLGSAGVLDERKFVKRVATLAIKTCVPDALIAAASVCKNEVKRNAMLAAAKKCKKNGDRKSALEARKAAADADDDDAYKAAYYAADAADYGDADDADANYAAYYAAAAVIAANYAASNTSKSKKEIATLKAKARDKHLAKFAEGVVQILIEMKAPGCKWLDLTE